MSFGAQGFLLCVHRRHDSCRASQFTSSEAAGATGVLLERSLELLLVEVRPQAVGEVQLGVGAFPEKKIAESLFAAGADERDPLLPTWRVE